MTRRHLHWILSLPTTALLSATCGTSVNSLLAQDRYSEASKRCSAERETGVKQECHRLVATELVHALERHIRWTGAYTFARHECGTLADLQERQTCLRQVGDAAFDRAERIRTWENGDGDDAVEYYTYALSAYEDAGGSANRERQKRSSYWVAFHDVEAGDELTAQRTLQAGNYGDAEVHAAFVSLCLRHPTPKCTPLAVKHMQMAGSSATDARRKVGEQCIGRMAQGFHADASACTQVAQSLRRLVDATQALRICFQDLGETAELRRWQGDILKKANADLQASVRDRADEEQVGDEMASPAKVVFGRARGDRETAVRDLGEMCRLRGRQLAEAELRLLAAAVEFAWAGHDGEGEGALAKAKGIAAISPAALTCHFGPSATDQGSGCKSLDRAPATVRTLLNEWRLSPGSTNAGNTKLRGSWAR